MPRSGVAVRSLSIVQWDVWDRPGGGEEMYRFGPPVKTVVPARDGEGENGNVGQA